MACDEKIVHTILIHDWGSGGDQKFEGNVFEISTANGRWERGFFPI